MIVQRNCLKYFFDESGNYEIKLSSYWFLESPWEEKNISVEKKIKV